MRARKAHLSFPLVDDLHATIDAIAKRAMLDAMYNMLTGEPVRQDVGLNEVYLDRKLRTCRMYLVTAGTHQMFLLAISKTGPDNGPELEHRDFSNVEAIGGLVRDMRWEFLPRVMIDPSHNFAAFDHWASPIMPIELMVMRHMLDAGVFVP